MRIQINYVVLPTQRLRELCSQHFDDPDYVEGRIWQSSEHHTIREHTRSQIEDAVMTAFFGSMDVGHMDSVDIDVRPLFRECLKLGFRGCFELHETYPPGHADELLRNAQERRATAEANIASLGAR